MHVRSVVGKAVLCLLLPRGSFFGLGEFPSGVLDVHSAKDLGGPLWGAPELWVSAAVFSLTLCPAALSFPGAWWALCPGAPEGSRARPGASSLCEARQLFVGRGPGQV